MAYFITQLKAIESQSVDFRINLTCVTFLYELFPFLDRGNFASALALMDQYQDTLYAKLDALTRARQAEICLYTALVYFGNKEFNKAHKFINQIILKGKNYYDLPLYRTIRLVNLLILFKLEDFELIETEIRTMKRNLMDTALDYKIERFLFKFLSKKLPSSDQKNQKYLDKMMIEINELLHSGYEKQILRIFDFTAWIESIIRKIPLSEVLRNRKNYDTPQ